MRKLWCAGAIAGGILLFGAAPAQADELGPGVAQGAPSPLRETLAQANNWRVSTPLASDPLSGQPLIDLSAADRQLLRLQPGDNTVGGLGSGDAGRPVEAATRAGRVLPAADVVRRSVPDRAAGAARAATGPVPFSALPIDTLVHHAAPALAALGPDGLPVARGNQIAGPGRHPVTVRTESAAEPARLPVAGTLAGLGGALPVNGVQRRLNVSGLPLGGSPVLVNPERGGSARPKADATATSQPAASTAPSGATSPPVAASPSASSSASPSAAVPPADAGVAGTGPSSASVTPVDPVAPVGPVTSAAADAPKVDAKLAKTRAADPRLFEEPTEGLPGAPAE